MSGLDNQAGFNMYEKTDLSGSGTETTITFTANNFSVYTNHSYIDFYWNFIINGEIIYDFTLQLRNKTYSIPFVDSSEGGIPIRIKPFDTMSINYRTNKKLNPMKDEFFYPFDKYNYSLWSGSIKQIPYVKGSMVSFPDSFYVSNASAGSPLIYPQELVKEIKNKTSNQTIHTETLAKFTFITDMVALNQKTNCQLNDLEGTRFCISPSLFVSPKELIETYNFYNLTSEDLNGKIKNEKTGYYFYLELKRTSIIIYIFWISLALITLSSVYFVYVYQENRKKVMWQKRMYLSYQSAFVVWAFQEGIIALSSLSRPLIFTVFDLTIFVPLVVFISKELRTALQK